MQNIQVPLKAASHKKESGEPSELRREGRVGAEEQEQKMRKLEAENKRLVGARGRGRGREYSR
jgi:hypothetical protein